MENSKLLPIQRKQMRGFLNDFCKARKHAIPTQESYIRGLAFLGLYLKKDFKKTTKKDLEAYLKSISQKNQGVQIWYRVAIKVFYRWLLTGKIDKNEPFPPLVSWIKMGSQAPSKIRPEDLPTEKELKRLLTGCRNLRDTAYIKVLLDTGGRAGEILNTRVKHVHLNADLPYIEFPISKTEPRPVPLIDSVRDLKNWLEEHPQKGTSDFQEAFIFVPINKGATKKYMLPTEYLTTLKIIAKRAGVEHRIWNHLFRHISCSTDAAASQSQPMAHAKYGWSARSTSWMRYSHPGMKDIAHWAMRARGMSIPNESTPRAPKICPRCKESNAWDKDFCGKCTMPLNAKVVSKLETKEKQLRQKYEAKDKARDEQMAAMKKLLEKVIDGDVDEELKKVKK